MTTKPTSKFDWATDVSALTTEPSSAQQQPGYSAATEPSPHWQNWWQRLMHHWVRVLQQGVDEMGGTPLMSQQLWGPGIDGDVSITSAVQLTRDMFYDNLTMEAGGSIEVHGHRIFVKDTFDLSRAEYSAIWSDASQAADLDWGIIGATIAGGVASATPPAATGLGGITGGGGGKGGSEIAATGSPDSGGASRVMSLAHFDPNEPGISPFIQIYGGMAGSGGGNGGPADAGGAGGPGGAGGGIVWISAQNIRRENGRTAAACIRAAGVSGTNGADSIVTHKGGGGAGGGGAGGAVFIRSRTLLGSGVINAIDVSGGAGGDAGTGLGNVYAAKGGDGGGAGNIYYWNVSTETFTSLTGATGTLGYGEDGGAGGVLLGDL